MIWTFTAKAELLAKQANRAISLIFRILLFTNHFQNASFTLNAAVFSEVAFWMFN